MSADRQRCLAILLLVPSDPVTKNTPSNDATPLAPIMGSVSITMRGFLVRQPIVVGTRRLMSEVLQAVPLRAGLCVYVHFVVHGFPVCEVGKVDFLLVKLFATEARKLHVVKRPVELNVFTGADFFGRGLDDGRSKQIDSCIVLVRSSQAAGTRGKIHPTSSFFPFLS